MMYFNLKQGTSYCIGQNVSVTPSDITRSSLLRMKRRKKKKKKISRTQENLYQLDFFFPPKISSFNNIKIT